MANLLPPIPNDPIQESHGWREWFYNLGRYIEVAQAGGTPWTVPQGGSGGTSFTGYLKGMGTSAFTASTTIPYTDISGAPVAGVLSIVTKTANYTLVSTDYTIRADATSGAITMTLPASPTAGRIYNIKKIDSSVNTVTIAGNGYNIDGAASTVIVTQYTNLTIQYDGTSTTWNIL